MIADNEEYRDISVLVGLTLTAIDAKRDDEDGDIVELWFRTECGRTFRMFHEQDCCETVYLNDCGGCSIEDVVGDTILHAETASTQGDEVMQKFFSEGGERHLWTFYKISTVFTSLTLRWLGSSNGYYAEDVSFVEVLS